MNTGENTEALRKIIDMTRKISIVLLVLHFYVYCYQAFHAWGLSHPITDKIFVNLQSTGLFKSFLISKIAALGFLLISLIGAKGKKDENLKLAIALRYLVTGLVVYMASQLFF